MTYRQVCSINNNQIELSLPADFSDKKQVTVVIEDIIDTKASKMALLIDAKNDHRC